MENFKRNDFLAVWGEDEQIWFCKLLQNIHKKKKSAKVIWLEYNKCNEYRLENEANMVPVDSMICKVKMKKIKADLFHLPPRTRLKLDRMLESDKNCDEVQKSNRKRKSSINDAVSKPKKVKIDKSNPNWKLKPRQEVQILTTDPLFEGKCDVPFISTSVNSHLINRAVRQNDIKMLQKYLENCKEISFRNPRRSMANPETPLTLALVKGNQKEIQMLLKDRPKAPRPTCILETISTGNYNPISLGIKHIRKLNPSRGGREGNNAFAKDDFTVKKEDIVQDAIAKGVDFRVLKRNQFTNFEKIHLYAALNHGKNGLASNIMDNMIKTKCYNFSKFHLESLTKDSKEWDPPIREVSAKKCGEFRLMPLHTAAINPNTKALAEIYDAHPDVHVVDGDGNKPIHFAATCDSIEPLKFLLSKGAVIDDTTKDGKTPLLAAALAGRVSNVEFIFQQICTKEYNENFIKKFGVAGIDRPMKNTWNALHASIVAGHLNVVEKLLELGANVEKTLGANCKKLTPLMLAAAHDRLDIVQMMVNKYGAKVEKADKLKRTAVTHACMNGSTKVLSYLLHIGASVDKVDTSGNSNLHYACAYGWYFCAKLLIDSGADPNAENEWKVTPLAVSLLKGHSGMAKWLMGLPGVDVNGRDDKGRSVIMMLIEDATKNQKEECPLTETLLEDICGLIDKKNADPNLTDYQGRNILHYLSVWQIAQIGNENESDREKILLRRSEMQLKFVQKFLSYQLDAWTLDENGDWPVSKGLLVSALPCWSRNYPLIKLLLNHMRKEPVAKSTGNSSNMVLMRFAENFSVAGAVEEFQIFNDLTKITSKTNCDMVDVQEDQYRPFIRLCMAYAGSKPIFSRNSDSILGKDNWKTARDIITKFIEIYSPVMAYDAKIERSDSKKTISASLAILGSESSLETTEPGIRPGFQIVLKYSNVVDCLDVRGLTMLFKSCKKGHFRLVLNLLHAGADPNFSHKIPKAKTTEESITNPLLEAIKIGHLEIVRLLLRHKASVDHSDPKSNPFLRAVQHCSKDRENRDRFNIVQELLQCGANINAVSDHKMNALHLSLGNLTGRADESIDLEILLIKHKIDLFAKYNGRYPLHCLFNIQSGDPIEVCNIIIEAMEGKNLDTPDQDGLTTLHHAAKCGATICCITLIDFGADMEAKDNLGNTPLAYCIMNGHESCALMLMQKGANVNVTLTKQSTLEIEKDHFKFLPRHFEDNGKASCISLFQGLVGHDWLGLTFIALRKMEQFGMSFAKAVEVAFHMKKFQFAKRLIDKQTNDKKIKELLGCGRTLMTALAFECTHGSADIVVLVETIDLLLEAGLDFYHSDANGCTALHYACLNKNLELMQCILKKVSCEKVINQRDLFGRTPILSLLWTSNRKGSSILETVKYLIQTCPSIDLNIKAGMKPLSFIDKGYKAQFQNVDYINLGGVHVTSLIVAIAHCNRSLVQLLLKHGAHVDQADSKGMTPLMYAMKTNDLAIVKCILSKMPSLSAQDENGFTAFHHAIFIEQKESTFDNIEIFTELAKSNSSLIKQHSVGLYKLAIESQAYSIADYLKKFFDFHPLEKSIYPLLKVSPTFDKFDVEKDAWKMMEILEKSQGQKVEIVLTPLPGCIVKDGILHCNYNVQLMKIDLSRGSWGLYNYYRLQLWKEKHKDLFVLFTNWGRIGDPHGQYQNTPFAKEEEATKAFEKIFKEKTGNEFSCSEFIAKRRKYRLVENSKIPIVKKKNIAFDLETEITSKLDPKVQDLIKELANVSMYIKAYKALGVDQKVLPFGRIKKNDLVHAEKLLNHLGDKITKKEALMKKKLETDDTAKIDKIDEDLHVILEEIFTLSSEYYYLVPMAGFEFVRATPISDEYALMKQKHMVANMKEFEIAERFLLGAQFRKNEINPLDYIYAAIKCNIEVLHDKDVMVPYILRFIYNSRGFTDSKISAIYKVSIQGDDKKPLIDGMVETGLNRHLLWHGTKAENLISILTKGLVIDAPYAEKSGSMFGNGLYFADVADKSRNYSRGFWNQKSNDSGYMLLCDTALGRSKILHGQFMYEFDHEKEFKKGFQSIKAVGQNIPKPSGTLRTCDSGVNIPLGSICPSKEKESYLSYSEYVVYDSNQVAVRYLIHFK